MPRIEYSFKVPKLDYLGEFTDIYNDGCSHPLDIETEDWQFIWVKTIWINPEWDWMLGDDKEVARLIKEAIRSDPKVSWAVNHSFDGAYIRRCPSLSSHTSFNDVKINIGVYLKAHQATFWKLKYGA